MSLAADAVVAVGDGAATPRGAPTTAGAPIGRAAPSPPVDDMPDARYFAPPLTSVYMDFVGLGRAGFEMITHRIDTGERAPRRLIKPSLVVRESSATPR